ncbi:Rhodanese-like domain-containing protein 9, chloroplastic [Asimina triloba]
MAGLANCPAAFSSSRTPWVALKIHGGTSAASLKLRNRRASIRAEVNFVDGDEARRLVAEEGYAILDIRDRTQYDRSHIKSCYHVPLFVENKDNDLGTIIKRTVHNNFSGLFFGLPFTKLNPDFVESVKEQFSTDSKLLLVCQGGLRSTAAANELEEEGFQNVSCVMSGLQSVKPGCSTDQYTWIIQIFNMDNVACIDILVKAYRTFESVGSTELQDAGKAGLVTIQGKISAVLGTGKPLGKSLQLKCLSFKLANVPRGNERSGH